MLRFCLFRLLMRISPSEKFGRVHVHNVSARSRRKDGRLEKVVLALGRIDAVCPGLMMRVRNNLDRVVVLSDLSASVGEYDATHRACLLAARFVDVCSLDSLSTIIVHEATHAALHDRGLSCTGELETWGEELCRRVERRFYQKATGKKGRYYRLFNQATQQ